MDRPAPHALGSGAAGSHDEPPAGTTAVDDAAAAEYWAARPLALRALRLASRASADVARALASSGAVRLSVAKFAPCPEPAPAASRDRAADREAAALRREALRLWRAAAGSGAAVPSADAMFPILARALHPPTADPGNDGLWEASRDVLQLFATLLGRQRLDSPPHEHLLSRECCAAVVEDASRWVSGSAVEVIRCLRVGTAFPAACGSLAAALWLLVKCGKPGAAAVAAEDLMRGLQDSGKPKVTVEKDSSLVGSLLKSFGASIHVKDDSDDDLAAAAAGVGGGKGAGGTDSSLLGVLLAKVSHRPSPASAAAAAALSGAPASPGGDALPPSVVVDIGAVSDSPRPSPEAAGSRDQSPNKAADHAPSPAHPDPEALAVPAAVAVLRSVAALLGRTVADVAALRDAAVAGTRAPTSSELAGWDHARAERFLGRADAVLRRVLDALSQNLSAVAAEEDWKEHWAPLRMQRTLAFAHATAECLSAQTTLMVARRSAAGPGGGDVDDDEEDGEEGRGEASSGFGAGLDDAESLTSVVQRVDAAIAIAAAAPPGGERPVAMAIRDALGCPGTLSALLPLAEISAAAAARVAGSAAAQEVRPGEPAPRVQPSRESRLGLLAQAARAAAVSLRDAEGPELGAGDSQGRPSSSAAAAGSPHQQGSTRLQQAFARPRESLLPLAQDWLFRASDASLGMDPGQPAGDAADGRRSGAAAALAMLLALEGSSSRCLAAVSAGRKQHALGAAFESVSTEDLSLTGGARRMLAALTDRYTSGEGRGQQACSHPCAARPPLACLSYSLIALALPSPTLSQRSGRMPTRGRWLVAGTPPRTCQRWSPLKTGLRGCHTYVKRLQQSPSVRRRVQLLFATCACVGPDNSPPSL